MKNRAVLKNIFTSGGTRLAILAIGFILPRLMITSFGSEINGLVSTVVQIFTYLALLEAGIGNSTINALYAPLRNANNVEISEIMTEAKRYYRKVSLVYGLLILLFSVVYPFLTNTDIDKWIIFGIIILQGASNFLNYYFCAILQQLLIADGKKYVLEHLNFVIYILSSVAKILLIYCGFNIIAIQISGLLISMIAIPVLMFYIKKKYPNVNMNTEPQKNYLKERKAFIVHEVSTVIFHNTDVFLVSIFCGFKAASVYTVYNMIFSSIFSLISSANSGLGFVFGNNLNKGSETLCRIYDRYTVLYMAACFALFTAAAILTEPFIALYTKGVTDINYQVKGLTLLFVAVNLLSCIRATSSRLVAISGHADKTKIRSLIEAGINIVSSIILAYFFNIHGVLLGTIIALLYRANDLIIYANKNILNRAPTKEYLNASVFILAFIAIYLIHKLLIISITTIWEFLLYSVIITLLCAFIYGVIVYLLNIRVIHCWLDKRRERNKTLEKRK